MSSHRPPPLSFPCHECEDRFQMENERERHRMQRHRGSFVVGICLLCGDLSRSKFDFRDHFQQNQMWIIVPGFKPIDSEEMVMDSIFSAIYERMELMGIGEQEEEVIVVEKEVLKPDELNPRQVASTANDPTDEIKTEPEESESTENQPKEIRSTPPTFPADEIKHEMDESESTENKPNEMGPTVQSQTDEIKAEEIDESETIENNEPFPFSSLSPIREFPATLGDEKPTAAAKTSPTRSPSTSESKKLKSDESKISKAPSSIVTEATSFNNFTAKIDDVTGISQSEIRGNENENSMADNLPERGELTHASTGHLKNSSESDEAKNEGTSSISPPLNHKKSIAGSEEKGEPAKKKSRSKSPKNEENPISSASVLSTAATAPATLKTILDAEVAAAATINSKAPRAANSLSPTREAATTLKNENTSTTPTAHPKIVIKTKVAEWSDIDREIDDEDDDDSNESDSEYCEISSTSAKEEYKDSMTKRSCILADLIYDDDDNLINRHVKKRISCPECGEVLPTCPSKAHRHFHEKHYDVCLFDKMIYNAVENWMLRNLGENEQSRRICLQCADNKRMYKSRKGLLSHIKKEHPTELDKLLKEHAKVSRKGGVTDMETHGILISYSAPKNKN